MADKPDFAKRASGYGNPFDTTASGLGLAPTYLANNRATATVSGSGGSGAIVGGRVLVTFASGSGTLTFPAPFTTITSVVVCSGDGSHKDVVLTVTGWTVTAANLYCQDIHGVAFAGTCYVAWIAVAT